MMFKSIVRVTSIASLLILPSLSEATILIDTSPDAIGILDEFGAKNISSDQNFVTQFSLSGLHDLSGIDSYHENFGFDFLGFHTKVRIFADDNGSIGPLLHDIDSIVSIVDFDGDSNQLFERRFTPFTQTLDAGIYWIGVSGLSEEFGQMLVDDVAPREHQTAQMEGTVLDFVFPDNLGSFDQASIRLHGSSVPEPTTLTLATLALLPLGWWRRRISYS